MLNNLDLEVFDDAELDGNIESKKNFDERFEIWHGTRWYHEGSLKGTHEN